MRAGAGDGSRVKRALKTGNRATSQEVRGDNFYQSKYAVVPPLLVAEGKRLPRVLWEPHCGGGALVNPLRNRGFVVTATDLVDRGCRDSVGGVDFLSAAAASYAPVEPRWGIVANPPFRHVERHIERAMELADYAAFFLRFSFLEGITRMRWFPQVGLRRVHLIADRLPFMHGEHVAEEDRTMDQAGMAFAWFIFERGKRPSRTYAVRPISWKAASVRYPQRVDGLDDPTVKEVPPPPSLFDLPSEAPTHAD